MMTLWRRKEKGASFGSKWETFLQSHNKHTKPSSTQPNPKANQKQNQNPLKSSFSMKVHGCSRENENEFKERKNERLSHLGPINNHYREEKWVLFVQHQGSRFSNGGSWRRENYEEVCWGREFQHKRGFMTFVISLFHT